MFTLSLFVPVSKLLNNIQYITKLFQLSLTCGIFSLSLCLLRSQLLLALSNFPKAVSFKGPCLNATKNSNFIEVVQNLKLVYLCAQRDSQGVKSYLLPFLTGCQTVNTSKILINSQKIRLVQGRFPVLNYVPVFTGKNEENLYDLSTDILFWIRYTV